MTATNMASLNEMILKLREKTGAGMTACKTALVEAGNDFDKALESLRKKGLADAAKKSARTTREGLIASFVTPDGRRAALIELNCETDFVAKTEEFQALAGSLAKGAAEGNLKSPEDARAQLAGAIAKLGENMSLKRLERYELAGPGLLSAYVHTAGGKKGALVELAASAPAVAASGEAAEIGKKLALQIVGMSPRWVRREDVPAAEVAKEREIYSTVVRQEGKPEAAVGKIVEGKLGKLFFGAFCLLEQPNMWDNKAPIKDLVATAGKAAGGSLEVKRFVRYQLGGE